MRDPRYVQASRQDHTPHPRWAFLHPEIPLDEEVSGLLELSQHLHAHRYFGEQVEILVGKDARCPRVPAFIVDVRD